MQRTRTQENRRRANRIREDLRSAQKDLVSDLGIQKLESAFWDQMAAQLDPLVKLDEAEQRMLRAQAGPQAELLRCSADVCIFGGGAGGGKSWGLLLDAARHIHDPNYSAVIFRRTNPQIMAPGGLWQQASTIYPLMGAAMRETRSEARFPSGAIIRFAHMEHELNRFDWQGSAITMIGWDELTHFEAEQFWYLFSRNRGGASIKPYIRATCNPDPDSFVAELVEWWIDQETGFPILDRAGKIRYFARIQDKLYWSDEPYALINRYPGCEPKSLTFIPSLLADNQALNTADPSYKANLMALPLVERERLLNGNWKIRASAGKIFNRDWFEVVERAPEGGREVRYWDKATSISETADRTAGVRIRRVGSMYYVTDALAVRFEAATREKLIRQMAELDTKRVQVYVEQEPGSGGKESADFTIRNLAGFTVRADRVTGPKVARWGPLAAQCEAGNVKIVRGPWNHDFLSELHGVDGTNDVHDDYADAAAGAFNKLAQGCLLTGIGG